MKLDSVLDSRIRQINAPLPPSFSFAVLLEQLAAFQGDVIIQTMFLHGVHNGRRVDNTTEEEISGWLDALRRIRPRRVMIYTLDREAPVAGLAKAPQAVLEGIAARARALGFVVSVSA
jgi:wyosine [tRNA(Phe)-imidazoG37] synthetase (radical SAM superfamily)